MCQTDRKRKPRKLKMVPLPAEKESRIVLELEKRLGKKRKAPEKAVSFLPPALELLDPADVFAVVLKSISRVQTSRRRIRRRLLLNDLRMEHAQDYRNADFEFFFDDDTHKLILPQNYLNPVGAYVRVLSLLVLWAN